MATLIVYVATDADVYSEAFSYANAQNAATTVLAGLPGATTVRCGQRLVVGVYRLTQIFEEYDTSALGATATVSAAVLERWLVTDESTVDHQQQVRLHDWGGSTPTASDYVVSSSLSGLTLLATIATSGIGSTGAFKTYTSETAFPGAINKTGYTRFVGTTDRMVAGTTPSSGNPDGMLWSSGEGAGVPKLTITYTVPTTGTGAVAVEVPAVDAAGIVTVARPRSYAVIL